MSIEKLRENIEEHVLNELSVTDGYGNVFIGKPDSKVVVLDDVLLEIDRFFKDKIVIDKERLKQLFRNRPDCEACLSTFTFLLLGSNGSYPNKEKK